jgi:mannose-6-phosphate isomerase-like protein (cupin superfamily)
MIRPGDVLDNPVTGERLHFLTTASQTKGRLTAVVTVLAPDGFAAGLHIHPYQEERFRVHEGAVGFVVGRRRVIAGPGQNLTVAPGTPHRFYNAGHTQARFVAEVRPSLRFEQLIETMFSLAAAGRTGPRGLPNLLQLAALGRAYFDTVRLPYVPSELQRAALALAAPPARWVGYKAFHNYAVEEPVRAA